MCPNVLGKVVLIVNHLINGFSSKNFEFKSPMEFYPNIYTTNNLTLGYLNVCYLFIHIVKIKEPKDVKMCLYVIPQLKKGTSFVILHPRSPMCQRKLLLINKNLTLP